MVEASEIVPNQKSQTCAELGSEGMLVPIEPVLETEGEEGDAEDERRFKTIGSVEARQKSRYFNSKWIRNCGDVSAHNRCYDLI
jgi:hypothetical protein